MTKIEIEHHPVRVPITLKVWEGSLPIATLREFEDGKEIAKIEYVPISYEFDGTIGEWH